MELALLFLRLGATAFGGPAAHIAMLEDEVVRRRRWLSEERFLDLLGATNLIPGPNSTEMAIHVGWTRRRFAGLVVAGASFILPAMLLTAVCGWAYVRFAALPALGWVLYGVKPAILGVIAQAIAGLAPKALKSVPLVVLGAVAVALAFAGLDELVILFGAGAAAVVTARFRQGPAPRTPSGAGLLVPAVPLATAAAAKTVTLAGLFGSFLKIGSVLFGSGYVLIAFLRAEFVARHGWLTQAELVDAVAVGQVTPGPVFTTATFIGYVLAGPSGACVATAGIFLPAFVFVALSGPLVPRLRASPVAGAFLDGVNVASLALMVAVTVALARATLIDVPTVLIALVGTAALVRLKLNATWLVSAGALVGAAVHWFGR